MKATQALLALMRQMVNVACHLLRTNEPEEPREGVCRSAAAHPFRGQACRRGGLTFLWLLEETRQRNYQAAN